jgi:ABC-2 type transport system permease protein
MRRFAEVALAVAWRSIHTFVTNPAFVLPAAVFPLFFFTAFAGGLSGVDEVPGFDYPAGYTAFQFVFVFLQASAFGGVFTGFSVAADFEHGFARRLMLAAPARGAIVVGYALAGLARAGIVGCLLFAVALLTGMRVPGGIDGILGLIVLGAGMSLSAMLFATGIALRTRTIQSGPLMQTPVFLLLFIAPVYVPLDLIDGWLHAASTINPFTAVLGAGRDLVAGLAPSGLAFLVVLALVALFALWARTGLARAEQAGS